MTESPLGFISGGEEMRKITFYMNMCKITIPDDVG